MRLLLLDAGSSSVKFRLLRENTVVLDGFVDRVGERARMCVHAEEYPVHAMTPVEAFARIGELVHAALAGQDPEVIAHRIVHGGEHDGPVVFTATVLSALERYVPRAPLHQGPQLAIARASARAYPRARNIGCFDTTFHRKMPAVARTVAIPHAIAHAHDITRVGYHGLAHEAMLVEAAAMMGRRPYDVHLITVQLGNGVSACAIADRHSVDTTMGFTPLEGVVMGTRSGSLDPAIVVHLCTALRTTPTEVLRILEHESGLLGLAGSHDVRDLLAREHTDARAKLALDVYAYRIKQAIGSLWVTLGHVDAIVLAGGVSQSPVMRRRILQGLEGFGIILDQRTLRKCAPAQLSTGSVPVFVVQGDELEIMRRQVAQLRSR